MKSVSCAGAFSAVLLVAACGGGGGGSNPGLAPVATSYVAQGVYQGTTSTGLSFSAIVLDDNSIWAVYGAALNGGLSVSGLFTGAGSAGSTGYTAATRDFPYPGNAPITGSLTASYVAGVSFNGTLAEGNLTETFQAVAPASSLYNYNTAAQLSAVSGTWTGQLLDGESATISVGSSGQISGSSSMGCTFTGSLAPRAGGKNIFDATIDFGASPCAAPNQTSTGIAVAYPIGSGLTQLVAAVTLPSGAAASAFFAQR